MKSTCTPILVCVLLVCSARTSQGSLIQGLLDFALLNPVETGGGSANSNSSAFPTESVFPKESPFPAERFPSDSAFTSNIVIQKGTFPPNSGSSTEPGLPSNPSNPVFLTDHVPSNMGSSVDTGFPSDSNPSGSGFPTDPRVPVDPFPPPTGFPSDPAFPTEPAFPTDQLPADFGFPADPGFPPDPFQPGTGSPADPGFPSDPAFPAEPAFPTDQFPADVGFPAGQEFPFDPFASGPTFDVNPTGGGSSTAWDSSPLFRFLPHMPTGKNFINLNTDTTHTFQPTENWMGEPIGPAGPAIDTVVIDPFDPTFDTVVVEPFAPAIDTVAIDPFPPFIDTVDPVGPASIDTSSPAGNNVDITKIGPLVPSNEVAIKPVETIPVTPEVMGPPFQSELFPPNIMGSVDIIPDNSGRAPAMGNGVIPLGPAFGTPVILGSVTGSGVQAQIPMNWMQLYPRDRPPPRRTPNQAPLGLSEAPQVSPANLWMEQASLNNFSKHRGISRKLRQERKLARKQRKLKRLRQKQQQRQQQKQQQKRKQRNKGKRINNTDQLPPVAHGTINSDGVPRLDQSDGTALGAAVLGKGVGQKLGRPGMGQGAAVTGQLVGQTFGVTGMGQGGGHTLGAAVMGQGPDQALESPGMGQGGGQAVGRPGMGHGGGQTLGAAVMRQGPGHPLGSPGMGHGGSQMLERPGIGQGSGETLGAAVMSQGLGQALGTRTGRGNSETLGGVLIGNTRRVQQRIIGVHTGVGIRGRIRTLRKQIRRLKNRTGGMNKRGRHGNYFKSFRHIDPQSIGQPLRDSVSVGNKSNQKRAKRKLNKKMKIPKMRQPTGMTPVDLSSFDSSVNTIQGQTTANGLVDQVPMGELPVIQPHQVVVDSGAIIPIIQNQGVNIQQTLVDHSVPALTRKRKNKNRNKKSRKQRAGKNKNKKIKPGKQGGKRWMKNGAKLIQGKQPTTNAPGDPAVTGNKQNNRLRKGGKIFKKNNKPRNGKMGKKKKSPIIRQPKHLKPVDLSFLHAGSKVTKVRQTEPVPTAESTSIEQIPGFGYIDWGQPQGTGTAIHP